MTESDEKLPVLEFLASGGAIGLIARIKPEHGNIKAELNEKTAVDPETVTRRLKEAQEADLIQEGVIRPGDHGRSNRYVLTERGKEVQSVLREMGLDELHREFIERKQEFEEAIPDAQNAVREENLHHKYPGKDEWERTDPESLQREREELEDELAREYRSRDKAEESDTARSEENSTNDGGEGDGDADDEDLGRTETWGTESDEADEEVG